MELAQVNFQRIKRAYVDVDVNVTMPRMVALSLMAVFALMTTWTPQP